MSASKLQETGAKPATHELSSCSNGRISLIHGTAEGDVLKMPPVITVVASPSRISG